MEEVSNKVKYNGLAHFKTKNSAQPQDVEHRVKTFLRTHKKKKNV